MIPDESSIPIWPTGTWAGSLIARGGGNGYGSTIATSAKHGTAWDITGGSTGAAVPLSSPDIA